MQRTSSHSTTAPVPDDLLEVLVGTPLRLRILEALLARPLDRRDLADETNVARTTLRHNLERLLEAGLLEETLANEYRVTARGRVAMGAVETYRSRVEIGLRLEPFLRRFPLSERSLEVTWFEGAELTIAEPGHPRAAGQRILSAIESASSLYGFLPCLPGRAEGRIESLLTDPDREVRLLLDAALIEAIDDVFGEVDSSADGVRLAVASEPPVFGGLLLEETKTLLLVLEDGGRPHATLETTDRNCRQWLTELLDDLDTTPLAESNMQA